MIDFFSSVYNIGLILKTNAFCRSLLHMFILVFV